jgi:site-specific DNA-methyltransferase (adenine-specific)
LRDYGKPDQLGLEATPQEYVAALVRVMTEVRRVLVPDGTSWLNLGDSYASAGSGVRAKSVAGLPWRVAFALQDAGWILRQDIVWAKPNPMPESVRDRCTRAHEYVFLLTKQPRYWFDAAAIAEPASGLRGGACFGKQSASAAGTGAQQRRYERPTYTTKNRRSVWRIAPGNFSGAHFAVMPQELARLCILAGCPPGGTVLDPFAGSGTTLVVAAELGRSAIGIELSAEYLEIARERVRAAVSPPVL